jgi:hypothetical protein
MGLSKAVVRGPDKRLAMVNSVGAILGDGLLCELISETNLKLATVEAALAFELGNVKFAALFREFVRDLVGDEGGRGEDELERVDSLEFCAERLECVYRET